MQRSAAAQRVRSMLPGCGDVVMRGDIWCHLLPLWQELEWWAEVAPAMRRQGGAAAAVKQQ